MYLWGKPGLGQGGRGKEKKGEEEAPKILGVSVFTIPLECRANRVGWGRASGVHMRARGWEGGLNYNIDITEPKA